MKTHAIAAAIAAIGMTGCLFAAPARATCGTDLAQKALAPADAQRAREQVAGIAAALAAAQPAGLAASSQGRSALPPRAITGLWSFAFLSLGNPGIPDGAVIDAGFQTWHADGTEITNSSRPPSSSNFCMGVWDYSTDRNKYRLNHWALGWDTTGATFIGPANLREQVRLNTTGNFMRGIFTIDQYAADGKSLLVHLDGTVTARRIGVN